LAILMLPVLLSFSADEPKEKLFDGVWQFTEGNLNGGPNSRPENVQMKVFRDGKFEAYVMTPKISAKTMEGSFKVLNDSVYTETLENALNKVMIGKTYEIKYQLKGNVMIMNGSFDADRNGVSVKVNYTQTWTRVDYPKLN